MTLAVSDHGNTAHSAAQPLRLWFGLPVAITQASVELCISASKRAHDDHMNHIFTEMRKQLALSPADQELIRSYLDKENTDGQDQL